MSKFYMFVAKSIFVASILVGVTACGSTNETPTATPPMPPATATAAPTEVPATVAAVATPTAASEQPQLADMLVILARAEEFTTFVKVVEDAGLTEQLQGAGPFTILVPPNAAWNDLPAAVQNNADLMRNILLSHLVEGHVLISDMIAAEQTVNLRGDELAVLVGDEGATVQGANVLGADFEANNGVIHLIDTVILPQAATAEVMAHYPSAVGEQTYPMQGNIHIANGRQSPEAYNSVPPTSGPHYPNIVMWQVYEEPFRYEQLIHNLEDSGVILYYQCEAACPELVAQLRAVVQPYIDGGRHVVVAPNDPTWVLPDGSTPHQDMGAPIAVTAWRKLLKLNEVDEEKIRQFIDAYEGIDHHVK